MLRRFFSIDDFERLVDRAPVDEPGKVSSSSFAESDDGEGARSRYEAASEGFGSSCFFVASEESFAGSLLAAGSSLGDSGLERGGGLANERVATSRELVPAVTGTRLSMVRHSGTSMVSKKTTRVQKTHPKNAQRRRERDERRGQKRKKTRNSEIGQKLKLFFSPLALAQEDAVLGRIKGQDDCSLACSGTETDAEHTRSES
jgi:hypothetical protein